MELNKRYAALMLMEILYRCMSILKGTQYHK